MVQCRIGYTAIIFFFLGWSGVKAQYFEGGLMLGASLYEGDLSPHGYFEKLDFLRPAAGIFGRQNFNEHWAVRLSFQYGNLEGADRESRKDRNLNFNSTFGELAAMVEFSYPGYDPAGFRKFSPYAFAGIAYMYYNPRTTYQGRTVYLQPLGTEGQGLDGYDKDFYSLNIVSIPFGGGLKYALSPSLTLAVEFGPRITFTDYLDDVSGTYASYRDLAQARGTLTANLADRAQEITGLEPEERRGAGRGNSRLNDWYFVGGVTISYHFYNLLSGKGGCPMTF
jgi:opacity protein-like surface antigen